MGVRKCLNIFPVYSKSSFKDPIATILMYPTTNAPQLENNEPWIDFQQPRADNTIVLKNVISGSIDMKRMDQHPSFLAP